MAEKNQRAEQTLLGLGSTPGGAKREYKPFVPGPNPELPAFIKQHATPYDPKTDKYDVKAFDRDLVVDKAAPPKAIYDMHTYWSKKHWAAIREYIRHYLPKKYYPDGTGLVLDCFSGSGMTGAAAMFESRPCVLVDASPAAAFISHCYTHPVEPDELQAAYDRMMTEEYPADLKKKLRAIAGEDIHNLQQELDWLYTTKCDRCGGDATTDYVVYSERFQCPRCGEVVALFNCPEAKVPYLVGAKGKQRSELKKRRICPHCAKKYGDPHQDFAVSARTKRFGSAPVLVCYECQNGCRPSRSDRLHSEPQNTRKAKYFECSDIAKLKAIDSAQRPHDYPQRPFLRGVRCHRDAVWNRGVENVCDIKRDVLGGQAGADFKLGGRMIGCEFYGCLFFYLTRYLKGRASGRTPRRNLAEFLEECLVRFRDGDKWLYQRPTGSEATSLKESRQSGLGCRVRQFVAYLNGEGDFPNERIPDAKTLVAWLKHCANFGLAEAGVVLFEKGGLMGQLSQLGEEGRYDAEDYYAQCRRYAGWREDDHEGEGEGEGEQE